jgi:transcriptional regulator with XRE-family HTH domain
MSAIGLAIKQNRERLNLTQQELAVKLRAGLRTIEKYENGSQLPDNQTILKISTILDVPASELLEPGSHTFRETLDPELEQLLKDTGMNKAKLILKKAKEMGAEDFLRMRDMT